jgi:hypothetical protein
MALTARGAFGRDATGVTVRAADATERPALFTATTVAEYSVPLARPRTTQLVIKVTQLALLGFSITT